MENVKKLIAETLNEAADFLEGNKFFSKNYIAITVLGSEHGTAEVLKGAELAQKNLIDTEILVIGPKELKTSLTIIEATDEPNSHKIMEELLSTKKIAAAVTMHYNFPLGISTIGLVSTPAFGKNIFIASTTGTSATDRINAMLKNTIAGLACAKAYGVINPTIGILNVDGARQVERTLKILKANGYKFEFIESSRNDGGFIMRGNDLLRGTPDVLITDTLTGNLLMKLFSAFTTGGNYETIGFGYGPGIGENFDKLIHIISRASGASVICNALIYASLMAKENVFNKFKLELASANNAGFKDLLQPANASQKVNPPTILAPQKKLVTAQITGIDVLEIDNATTELWQNGVYAEAGMGCTGPIIMVNVADLDKANKILKLSKIIS